MQYYRDIKIKVAIRALRAMPSRKTFNSLIYGVTLKAVVRVALAVEGHGGDGQGKR